MVLIPSHLRRKPKKNPLQEIEGAKIIVVTPPSPEPVKRVSRRERIKKALEVPAHLRKRKQARPKTEFDELAEDTEELVATMEKLEGAQ